MTMNTAFLDACWSRKTRDVPIWFMRQAGRSSPAYRKIREKYPVLTICRTPELAAQVTMLPIRELGVDAAILFADIMLPLIPAGVKITIKDNVGPVIANPIKKTKDIAKLSEVTMKEEFGFLAETIRLLRRELRNSVPLIGFSGAPFTLASYMIEGGPTRTFVKTKSFMYGNKAGWSALMNKLTRLVTAYLQWQIQSGVQAVQLFDSWVGYLSPADYQEYVLPYTKKIFHAVGQEGVVPRIHFGVNTTSFLEDFASVECEVIGVDWRAPIKDAWKRIGYHKAIQGNLDPAVLLADFSVVKQKTDEILRGVGRRRGFIFNLGHGVLPQTSVTTLKKLVAYVHQS